MTPTGESAQDARLDGRQIEALRDRTDEIELIISGLTTVALFTLPGWLWETISLHYSHYSVVMAIGTNVLLLVGAGLFYSLGACFAVHLLIRAYWAGLIGLRTVFPAGIDWSRTFGIGPVTRAYYREKLPDLDQAITRADRLASSLFAVISLIALTTLWMSLLVLVVLVVGGVIGSRMGRTNEVMAIAGAATIVLLSGLPTLLWLLDGLLGRWFPRLQQRRGFTTLVRALAGTTGILFPQRLILPVQLTLQSNTRPRIFLLMLVAGVVAIFAVGQLRYTGWTEFSLSGEFRYLDEDDVRDGIRSTFYEDQRRPADRVRLLPMIDQFVQDRAFVRLFLPYQPLRDNLVLDAYCSSEARADCLRQLWSVSLDGRPIDTAAFIATERGDLGMRGLTGVIPLAGAEPGMHELTVVWNTFATAGDSPIDDRYREATRRYVIAFLFAPAYELGASASPEPGGNGP